MGKDLTIQLNIPDLLRKQAKLTTRIRTLNQYILDATNSISELAERRAKVTAQLKELDA